MTNQKLTIRALRISGRMIELLVISSGLTGRWNPVLCLVSWLLVIGVTQISEIVIKLYFKNVKETNKNERFKSHAKQNH